VNASLCARSGKKTVEGTMMLSPAPKSNPVAVAEPPETQNLKPATISDILVNGKI
jgi:hypothetical protein